MFAGKPRYRDDDYRSGAMHSRHLERVDGGYRVLDWEAVEYALDELCRRRKGEDPKALAEEHAHETKVWAHLRARTHSVRDEIFDRTGEAPVPMSANSFAVGSSQRATSARAVLTWLIWSSDELRRVAVSARGGGAGVFPGCR